MKLQSKFFKSENWRQNYLYRLSSGLLHFFARRMVSFSVACVGKWAMTWLNSWSLVLGKHGHCKELKKWIGLCSAGLIEKLNRPILPATVVCPFLIKAILLNYNKNMLWTVTLHYHKCLQKKL